MTDDIIKLNSQIDLEIYRKSYIEINIPLLSNTDLEIYRKSSITQWEQDNV